MHAPVREQGLDRLLGAKERRPAGHEELCRVLLGDSSNGLLHARYRQWPPLYRLQIEKFRIPGSRFQRLDGFSPVTSFRV